MALMDSRHSEEFGLVLDLQRSKSKQKQYEKKRFIQNVLTPDTKVCLYLIGNSRILGPREETTISAML